MPVALDELIEPPDPADYRAQLDGLQALVRALQADNWRLIAEKAARDASVWMTLKRASHRAACSYERARAFAERAIAAGRLNEARKDGGRVSVNVTTLIAHLRS